MFEMKIVLFVPRFWISKDHEESDLKCRFVACVSSPADGAAGGATAYVTSMAKGKVFQVNLTAGEDEGTVVKEMSLTKKVANDVDLMPPPPAPGKIMKAQFLQGVQYQIVVPFLPCNHI